MTRIIKFFLFTLCICRSAFAAEFDIQADYANLVFKQFCIVLYPLKSGALELLLEGMEHRELSQAESKQFFKYGSGKAYIVDGAKEFLLVVEDQYRCAVYMNGLDEKNAFEAWKISSMSLQENELADKRKIVENDRHTHKSYTYIYKDKKQALNIDIYPLKTSEGTSNLEFVAQFSEVVDARR